MGYALMLGDKMKSEDSRSNSTTTTSKTIMTMHTINSMDKKKFL